MKAWLTTGVFLLAIVQAMSAAWMWGRLPRAGTAPRGVAHAHRWTGTAAFLLALPVAYHCLWSLGFETDSGELRRFVHSVAGCAFYGAFVVKVLSVRSRRLPEWALPLAGGATFAALSVVWATSSLWFFQNAGFPEI